MHMPHKLITKALAIAKLYQTPLLQHPSMHLTALQALVLPILDFFLASKLSESLHLLQAACSYQ